MTILRNRHYFNPNFIDRKLRKTRGQVTCLKSHGGKQCQHSNPNYLSPEFLGLIHYTRVWNRVKDFLHKPNKSKPLNLGTAGW